MHRRACLHGLSALSITGLGHHRASAAQVAANLDGKFAHIEPAQPTETPGKIEIVDVFWFGCPHCYRFLDVMEPYAAAPPADVQVRRMPAIFRKSWEPHARAFYTAQLLGVADRLYRPIFEAIHVHSNKLSSKSALRRFFVANGVQQADFDSSYESFAVESRVHHATVMQQRYGITGTPTVVVGGKYRVSAAPAGGYEGMLDVAIELVERERKLS